MKFYTAIISFFIFMTVFGINSNAENEAGKIYNRLMNSAHPLPDKSYLGEPKVPWAKPLSNPVEGIFINVPTSVEETGTYIMQNESSIAVNPTNPLNLICSAVDYRDNSATWVYVSWDGGKSWKNFNLGRPHPEWRASNDPSVAFDNDGVGYMVYGAFGKFLDSAGTSAGENGVYIAKSLDSGKTWKAQIPIIEHKGVMTIDSLMEDKYYITVDNSTKSPYHKHLYVPWKRVTPKDMGTQIVISKSSDKADSWSVPVNVSAKLENSCEDTTFGQSFPLCATGPDGEVYVVWNYGPLDGVGFARSSDGGKTFSSPRVVQTYKEFGVPKNLEGQGVRHSVKGKVRAESYPTFVCDNRENGTGNLYLCWSGDNPPNIYFSMSSNKGDSWTTPKLVHQPINTDHFWPWLTLDPKSGDLAVMYFDSRNDTNNLLVDCYVSYSSDMGASWIDRRASDVSTDLRLNPFTANAFAGDYSGCAFYDGKIFPSWVDMRNAGGNIFDSDVFCALININTPNPPEEFKVAIIPDDASKLKLSWVAPTERAFGKKMTSSEFTYTIFRDGAYVTALPGSTTSYTDNNLNQHQKYTYKIVAVSGQDTSKERSGSAFSGGSKNPSIAEMSIADPRWTNVVDMNIKIPTKREDSLTPLTNASKIALYRDSIFLKNISINPSDTGKILTIQDTVPERGYYVYMAKILDDAVPPNESALSNEIVVFGGERDSMEYPSRMYLDREGFEKPRKYYYKNFSITDLFSHSSNHSLATSPEKNYKGRTSYQFWLFPSFLGDNSEPLIQFAFAHAAIVQQGDSAVIEVSTDMGKTWILGSWGYTKMDYPEWQDGTLDQKDWKEDRINISLHRVSNFGTYIVRFRLETDLLKHDKGWFIDDIKLANNPYSVEDSKNENKYQIYPNPASDWLNLRKEREDNEIIHSVKISDMYGNEWNYSSENLNQAGNSLNLKINNLPQGVYMLQIRSGNTLNNLKFNVIR